MTTWYLDPENGNDANGGTSFALRKKTLAAVTVAPGDSVRIIADYGPQSLGNAAWTDNSATLTLAAAQTLTVDNCEANWTGTAGITATAGSGYQKQGNNALGVTFGSGFNTGLVCYKALGALDLSAYACLSLWIYPNGGTMTTQLSIALCSDSAGATPIVTLPFPAWLLNQQHYGTHWSVLLENGGNPLPSGINSIALYAPAGRPFTGTIYLDNIIATKAYGAPGHLSHCSLVGKVTAAEPEWYPIQSIDGTKVVIGNSFDFGGNLLAADTPSVKYRGVSETVTTYALCPVRTRWTLAQATFTGQSGTQQSPVAWSGGWNRADMSAQTGTSWLSGEWAQQTGLNQGNTSLNWQNFPDKTVGLAHYATYALFFNYQQGLVGHFLGLVGNASLLQWAATYSLSSPVDLDLGNVVRNPNGVNPYVSFIGPYKFRARRITGGYPGINQLPAFVVGAWYLDALHDIEIGMIDNNLTGIGTSGSYGRARIRGTTFKNNTQSVLSAGMGEILLDRPVLQDAVAVSFGTSPSGAAEVRCTNVNGHAWDNRVYNLSVTQQMVQAPTHGTTLQSLALTVGANYANLVGLPYLARIARIACFANSTVSFSAWMQRSTQYLSAGLLVQGGGVAGVADQTVPGSAANGLWEQVTISFTATEAGVVDVFGWVQPQNNAAANGAQVFFGDTSVTST